MTMANFRRDRWVAISCVFLGIALITASNALDLLDVPYIPIRYAMVIIAICLVFGPAVWIVLKYRIDRIATRFIIAAIVLMTLGMAFELPIVHESLMTWTGLDLSQLRQLIQDSLQEGGVALFFAMVVSLMITSSQIAWKSKGHEKKLAELNRDLQESQERLAEAQAVAGLGSWSWKRETDETVWSEQMFKVLGMSPDAPAELIFDTIDRMAHPDDHARVRAVANEVYTTGKARSVEFRLIRADGEERIIYADGTIDMDANGMPVEMLGTVLDVTERRRMQDELERRVEERTAELVEANKRLQCEVKERRNAEAEVRASERRFRETAENFDAVVWVQDVSDGKVLYVTPAYKKMWQRSAAELMKNPDAWLEAVHPEDREAVRKKFRDARDRKPYERIQVDYRLLWPDGSIRWIQDRTFPIRDAEGKVYRIGGVATDITEQRASAEALRHSDRLSVIGTLAAGVAHEINNPVGSILLSAQLAQKQMKASKDLGAVSKQLTSIVDDALRCGRIVKNVLTFSRPTSTEKTLANLNDVVQSAESLARKYVSSRKATLRLHLEDDLPQVLLNSTEMEQVLINLIRNALESKSEGVTVDITTQNDTDRVILLLEDDGAGIPADELKRLFDPFYTTRRSQGGTGLGLSITYGIVQEHGGTIAVESNVGTGTCVKLELPSATKVSQGETVS